MPASAPVSQKERIDIIDILRGVALLGILLMNIPYFSNPEQANFNLRVYNETSGPNYYTWWAITGLFEGTMRAMFTILFGAGCLLLVKRLENKPGINPADIYYRRLLWLLLFGFINAFVFLWPGDILYPYALCGLFIFPFRNMKAKHLAYIGAFLLIVTVAKNTYTDYSKGAERKAGEQAISIENKGDNLTGEQQAAKDAWLAAQERSNPDNIRKAADEEKALMSGGDYPTIWAHLKNINIFLQSTEFYNQTFLDIMLLLFLGMAAFKAGMITGARSIRFYFIAMVIGYIFGLAASYWYARNWILAGFDRAYYNDLAFVNLFQVKRILLAIGHFSLVMLLYKMGFAKRFMEWMRSVGQMAFTNYLMQSIICTTIFYGYGFGYFGKWQRYETYYIVGAIWIFQVVFSVVWLRYYRFGPFEWIWRSLTYWKKQPFIKKKKADEPETPEFSPALT